MLLRIGLRSLVLGALIAATFIAPALAVPTVAGEFKVSDFETNDKITAGPDGNMWMTVSGFEEDVAKVTPSGVVSEYDLKAGSTDGIAAGPGGVMWITRTGGVTSFSPADPEGPKKVETPIPEISGNSPMILGTDGNLWVATSGDLIRIPPSNPAGYKAFPIGGLSPTDIDVSGSLLAIADAGGQRVMTATMTDPPVTLDYPTGGQTQGVAWGPNGQFAYTQPVTEPKTIGLFTPPSKTPLITKVPLKDPFGIVLGADGAYWSAERNDDKLFRITTDNKVSELIGFAKGSSPRQIAAGPGNTLWVTLDEANKVAKVTGVDPPPPPPVVVVPPKTGAIEPRTTLTKGPKGRLTTRKTKRKVTFSFESPDAGATFECRVEVVLRKKKAKASVVTEFKPCASPKSFKLKTGRYRFEVRALLAGVPDQTPEKRSFRIVRSIAKK